MTAVACRRSRVSGLSSLGTTWTRHVVADNGRSIRPTPEEVCSAMPTIRLTAAAAALATVGALLDARRTRRRRRPLHCSRRDATQGGAAPGQDRRHDRAARVGRLPRPAHRQRRNGNPGAPVRRRRCDAVATLRRHAVGDHVRQHRAVRRVPPRGRQRPGLRPQLPARCHRRGCARRWWSSGRPHIFHPRRDRRRGVGPGEALHRCTAGRAAPASGSRAAPPVGGSRWTTLGTVRAGRHGGDRLPDADQLTIRLPAVACGPSDKVWGARSRIVRG